MPNFKSEKERQAWIIEHAAYFTIVKGKTGRRAPHDKETIPTLESARERARLRILAEPHSRWMIYAIANHCGTQIDTWVETVS